MPAKTPKIYIGCALTSAPEEFKSAVEAAKAQLKQDYEVFDFVGLENGTPPDVYQWDIHKCVAECDLFVAICDYPAIGLGYELAVAVEKLAKPVLALAHTDAHITRLIRGISAPHYQLARYTSFEEIPALVRAKLLKINVNHGE